MPETTSELNEEESTEDSLQPLVDENKLEESKDETAACLIHESTREATKRPQRNVKLPSALADFDLSH